MSSDLSAILWYMQFAGSDTLITADTVVKYPDKFLSTIRPEVSVKQKNGRTVM